MNGWLALSVFLISVVWPLLILVLFRVFSNTSKSMTDTGNAPRTDSFGGTDGCHCLSCEWIGEWQDTMSDRCPNCDSSDVYDNDKVEHE